VIITTKARRQYSSTIKIALPYFICCFYIICISIPDAKHRKPS